MSLSKPAGMQTLSTVSNTRGLAVLALRRFRNNGLMVDPENPEHIKAYLVLRQTQGAVNGKTLLAYVNSATPSVNHGAQSYVKYYVVPKTNFAGGLLPTDLLPSMHTPEMLEEAEVLADGSIDHAQFYVIDKIADRTRLGAGLRTIKFFTGSTTTLNTRGMQSHSQPQAANPQISITAPVAIPPPAAPASQLQAASSSNQGSHSGAPTACNTRRLLQLRGTDDEDAVDEPPAKKRKRKLADTMLVLRGSISSAAEEKKWHSDSAWVTNTVSFYVNEIIAAMQTLASEAHAAGESPAKVLLLIDKVWSFIASQLLSHAQFKDLCHFKDIFDKFSGMGATPTGTIKILVKMIAAKATCVCVSVCVCVGDDTAIIDFSDVDIVDRNQFRQTPLWQSYCEGKFRVLMAKAKAALATERGAHADGQPKAAETWMKHVEMASEIRPVDEGLL